jgi:hypothetical protein
MEQPCDTCPFAGMSEEHKRQATEPGRAVAMLCHESQSLDGERPDRACAGFYGGKDGRMKVVYIAGPYRAASEYEVVQNIRRAEALALEVWKAGAAAICPHMNTALWGGAAPDSVWLEGDLEILRRCDALLRVPGEYTSFGTGEEIKAARANHQPVFYHLADLVWWLKREGGLVS